MQTLDTTFAQYSVFTGEYTVGSKSPLEALQTVFGQTNFRPEQWNAISKISFAKMWLLPYQLVVGR